MNCPRCGHKARKNGQRPIRRRGSAGKRQSCGFTAKWLVGGFPKLYDWGGGGVPTLWTFGWNTGKDNDLICVKPNIKTAIEGELALSPACYGRIRAIFAFAIKAILIRLDTNAHVLLEGRFVATPTIDSAISTRIQVKSASAMTFPTATPRPSTIPSTQQLIASSTMPMSSLDTFASPTRPFPRFFNNANAKTSHVFITSVNL